MILQKSIKSWKIRPLLKSWGDGRYVTKRSFDVYEGAANNNNGVAGAFAAGGIGAGVGMNVAQAAGGDSSPDKSRTDGDLPEMRGKNLYREASSAIPAEQSWRWRKNAVPAAEKKMTGMPSSVMNAGSASWKEYANAGQSFRRALNSAMSAEGRYSKYSL